MGLEIIIMEDGHEVFGGVWDYRDDPEGLYYDIAESDEERKESFRRKKAFIDNEIEKRNKKRKETLGFDIEPIN